MKARDYCFKARAAKQRKQIEDLSGENFEFQVRDPVNVGHRRVIADSGLTWNDRVEWTSWIV